MSRPTPHLSQKLTRPLRTTDGGTLRSVLDARNYMLALPERWAQRSQWQRAAGLLLDEADVAVLTNAIGLALFYEAKLDLKPTSAFSLLKAGGAGSEHR